MNATQAYKSDSQLDIIMLDNTKSLVNEDIMKNLNKKCVDQPQPVKKSASKPESLRKRVYKQKRKVWKFLDEQTEVLKEYFKQDPDWKTQTIKAASKHLNVPETKVYKWGIDRKRKKVNKMIQNFNSSLKPNTYLIDVGMLSNSENINWNDAVDEICDILDHEYSYIKSIVDISTKWTDLKDIWNTDRLYEHKNYSSSLFPKEGEKVFNLKSFNYNQFDNLDELFQDSSEGGSTTRSLTQPS